MIAASPLEIGAVARALGVAPSTLRSWERRYRTVVPKRGKNGQRLYDSEQVVLLQQILAQTRLGVRARAAHDAAGTASVPVATSRLRLDPTEEAPQSVRREIDRLLADRPYPDRFGFDARLVASELVKNAVVHSTPQEQIDVEIALHPEWVDLRVVNSGPRLALKNLRARRRESGRGLEIVDALADSWSIDTGPRGTRVSVRLSTRSQADVSRSGDGVR